jgi:hypothetical protein
MRVKRGAARHGTLRRRRLVPAGDKDMVVKGEAVEAEADPVEAWAWVSQYSDG